VLIAQQSRCSHAILLLLRAQLVGQIIRPHLQSGGVALATTMPTAHWRQGLPAARPATLRMILVYGRQARVTSLYLDLDVEAGLKRKKTGGDSGTDG
jgi:hypothetical protein